MSNQKSLVWQYFTKLSKEKSKCDTCAQIIQCSGGTTTAMMNHLKIHDINLQKRNLSDEAGNETSSSKIKPCGSNILKFVKRESLNEILAKCAAKDGISFQAISKCEAIRGFVRSRNLNLPKSATTVKKNVMDFYDEKIAEVQKELQTLKKDDFKFSITVDEWTDNRVRRFMNVTLHSIHKSFVLGLIPIEGPCNSEKTLELVRIRLGEFLIDLDCDIVASTHDGAPVMVKYGRLLKATSQLCYNHGIHLAFVKIFYRKMSQAGQQEEAENYEEEDEYFANTEEDENDNESNFYNDANLNFHFPDLDHELNVTIRPDIGQVLAETRKTINFFKKSNLRNGILQKHVKQQENKHLYLVLDCKTRWNSLIQMIRRFLKIGECINKALDEIGASNIKEENITLLKEILLVSEPVELAVNELSKSDSNLLKAEAIFIYVFKKLTDLNTKLSLEMLESLKESVNERRNKDLVSLLYFLQNCTYPKSNEFFTYSSKVIIKTLGNQLYSQLFPVNIVEQETPIINEDLSESEEENDEYLIMKKTISSFLKVPKTTSSNRIDNDFKHAEGSGCRTNNLEKLYNALLTIQPTSTASERVFSVSGNFMTKIRSQLNMKTLNGLVFLKYYFLNKV